MQLVKRSYTTEEIKELRLKGAIYIRMSTEQQVESPENQEREIRAYAEKYSIEIVKIYADLGISGLTAKKRDHFLALIDDVEHGRNAFNIVLYLDESRWGRFVDSREAEYYRLRLAHWNVICQACDKPIVPVPDVSDRILTLLKDEGASDYSRQLSQKVHAGQCNLILKGYRQGGIPGFGLRRMLLDENGNHKQILDFGQRKSLQTERVILVPGPKPEQDKISWIYDQFIAGMNEREIADLLNYEGCKNHLGRPWSRSTVREILTNEKYIGNNLFNRQSGKLKSKIKSNPAHEWVRKEGAFVPIIDAERFRLVQGIIFEKNRSISDIEMLDRLKNLQTQKTRLSAMIIDESDQMPPSSLYRHRFGGLLRAYRLIGYVPERDYRYVEINQFLRVIHKDIMADTISGIECLCGRPIFVDPDTNLLELNHNLLLSIVISRCFRTSSGACRWKIRLDASLRPDITVAVRMDAFNEKIQDYYILPSVEFGDDSLKLREENVELLDSFRSSSLDHLLEMSMNINLDQVVPL